MENDSHKERPGIHPVDMLNLTSVVTLLNAISENSINSANLTTHIMANAIVIASLTIQNADDKEANQSEGMPVNVNNVGTSFHEAEEIIRYWADTIMRQDGGCSEPHPECMELYGGCPQQGQMYRSVMRIVETIFIQLTEAKTEHGNNEGTFTG